MQGVGFRYMCRHTAKNLGLTGWVRNEDDGTVTVYVEGAESALDSMKDFFVSSPGASRVTHVDYRDVIPLETFTAFSIEY